MAARRRAGFGQTFSIEWQYEHLVTAIALPRRTLCSSADAGMVTPMPEIDGANNKIAATL